MKINTNKTMQEFINKGFIFGHIELLYKIKEGVYLAFNMDELSDDFLKYIGEECFLLITQEEYESERLKALKELKEEKFIM